MKHRILIGLLQTRVSFIVYLLLGIFQVKAHNQPIYNVPSPEIANLGLYGQIPVSHFTGVPDISLPLYEVRVGKTTMPITASYHISCVKPNSVPGPLGLGWNLIAGGYITRTVRGLCDEFKSKDGRNIGFYFNTAKLKNVANNNTLFDEYTDYFVSWDKNNYELSADEFSFNFCGYSGNFYLNPNGGWTVVSDQDIKVEFDSTNGGFATYESIRNRFENYWLCNTHPVCFFNKFTMVTPDGNRYEFGGTDAVEFGIPYYDRMNSYFYATTWRLTKITTPENYIIRIDYDTDSHFCELQYEPGYRQIYVCPNNSYSGLWGFIDHFLLGDEEDYVTDSHPNKIGLMGFTGNLFFPVKIRTITTPNETVEFDYRRDEDFGRLFIPNHGWKALYWPMSNEYGTWRDQYNQNTFSPANQFNVLADYDVDLYNNPDRTRENVADWMAWYYLDKLTVRKKNSDTVWNYQFNYTVNNRRKLASIVKGTGVEASLGNESYKYQFQYETGSLMPRWYLVGKTDSWGFYHGDNNVLSALPDIDVIYPNFMATKAEVLTDIIYPTGGRTTFEYGENIYSQIVDSTHTHIESSYGFAGGLRIERITNRDQDNKITDITKYHYSQIRNSAMSSGISKGLPVLRLFYAAASEDAQYYLVTASSLGYHAPVTNLNSPDVGYSWVIEEKLDSTGTSQGYVRYRYSNYDADYQHKEHCDELAFYSYNTPISCYTAPYTSMSFERGKLLSKEYYTPNDVLLKKEMYQYSRVHDVPMLTATQVYINYGVAETKSGWLTYTHTASYLPDSVLTINYDPSNGTESRSMRQYTYNSHKMLSGESYSMSNGSTGTITYRYPYDDSSYAWMTNAHITAPLIGKTETAGGLTRTESTTYARVESGAPYIQKKTLCLNNGLNPKTLFSVSHADKYGNPVEITENSKTSVLLWGGYGQCLVARIENAGFMHCKYRLGLDPNAYSDKPVNELDYNRIFSARSRMPGSLFHIYKYNSSLLLESETLPNGMTDYYSYDVFGRLRERYHFNGSSKKLMTGYDYHYYNH